MPEDLLDLLNTLFLKLTSVGSGITILVSIAISIGIYLLVRFLILNILLKRVVPNKNKWLDKIIEARIPHLLTLLVPPIVIWALLPYYSIESVNTSIEVLSRLLTVYVAVVITMILNGVLQAIDQYYDALDYSKTFPITSILEVVRGILFVLSAVVIISILFRVPAIYILAAIGALIAAATVVFNNLILAFASGLILTSRRMIMIGDWIEIPELHINGEVLELTLTTVIVRNLDHTIGAVPSTYLLTNSFKNWRGVLEAGARQMNWPVYFDLNSVKPAGPDLLDEISRLPYGADILRPQDRAETRQNFLQPPPVQQFTGTNLGLFREYCSLCLKNHPLITSEKLLSVYLEAPTNYGIPMRVMVSTNETNYSRFLEIQSVLLEEILQLASVFGLKVYQINDRFEPILSTMKEP